MRISDWSSDVCSSDLAIARHEINAWFRNRWRRYVAIQARSHTSSNPTGLRGQGRGGGAQCDGRGRLGGGRRNPADRRLVLGERKGVVKGKRVSVRVDLGGRRFMKTKKHTKKTT